jgi:lipopolysaccharide O-acetyltransferase
MKNIYNKIEYLGILGIVRIIRDLIFSALFVKFGSLVRHPFYIRRLGKLKIGEGFRSGPGLVIDIIDKEAVVEIGYSFRAASRLHIGCASKVTIGNNVLIASDVYISDHSHGNYNGEDQDEALCNVNDRKIKFLEIFIGNNVWIGEKTCILPGVTIGDNSIIGSLSVVNKNLLPNSIYVGSPAKRIKEYDAATKRWIKIQ